MTLARLRRRCYTFEKAAPAAEQNKGDTKMEQMQYVCPKCGNTQYESDQFQATGGNFAKIFDVQNKKFITVSCTRCGYTELYRSQTDAGWDVLDFLVGG